MLIISSKSYINTIARDFFNKVLALGGEVQDKKSINDFVNQVSQVVSPYNWVCWPLTPSQSVGRGTVAPSLGGFGDLPASLVNGPLWTPTGITTVNASQQHLVINYPFFNDVNSGGTAFFVKKTSAWVSSLISTINPAATSTGWRLDETSTQIRYAQNNFVSFAAVSPLDTIECVGFIRNGNNAPIYRNGVLIAAGGSSTLLPSAVNQTYIGRIGGQYSTITATFCLFINLNISASDYLRIYNIYKSTLGQGLGLP